MMRVHGTFIALDGDGVLLRGPSGSGKSDIALRMIDSGALLVADDQTELWREGNWVLARAPESIVAQLEVRGVGIFLVPSVTQAPLRLVVDMTAPNAVERLPEPRLCEFFGLAIPLLALAPFEASAPAKLRLALRALVPGASPVSRVAP